MNKFTAWIKGWLVDLNIIRADDQPELELDYIKACANYKRLQQAAWSPTFDASRRQYVLSNAVAEMWIARDKLLAAGYKEKRIREICFAEWYRKYGRKQHD